MFVVAGESLVDLVSNGGEGTLTLTAHAGGSPYNCAIALARLGNETGFLCPISTDGFGDLLLAPLREAGVEVLIEARSAANTTLAVVTRNERGLPAYSFYRQGTAERDIDLEALLAALERPVALFQMGGFLPIAAEEAAIWLEVVREMAGRGAVLSIDPNVRPSLIEDFAAYRGRLDQFLDLAHIIKVSDEDLAALDAGLSLEDHAQALLGRPNAELVVVTRGENGAVGFTRTARAQSPIYPPERFGDTVGAGDSLMAGVLTALADRGALAVGQIGGLDAAGLEAVLRFGAATAGLNCGHVGCKPPKRAEVEACLAAAREIH